MRLQVIVGGSGVAAALYALDAVTVEVEM